MYPEAYACLRTFLELGFAAVHFSANELDRRKWMSNNKDFSWSSALDKDGGLLSVDFVQEFNQNATDESREWATAASLCYRECSEFIHGKHSATMDLPRTLDYSKETIEEWAEIAQSGAQSLLYLLFVRYSAELIPHDDSDQLIDILTSWFPDSKAVEQTINEIRKVSNS